MARGSARPIPPRAPRPRTLPCAQQYAASGPCQLMLMLMLKSLSLLHITSCRPYAPALPATTSAANRRVPNVHESYVPIAVAEGAVCLDGEAHAAQALPHPAKVTELLRLGSVLKGRGIRPSLPRPPPPLRWAFTTAATPARIPPARAGVNAAATPGMGEVDMSFRHRSSRA